MGEVDLGETGDRRGLGRSGGRGSSGQDVW